jgi:hypothetical protein
LVAAVHQACETLTGLAHAEHDQIRAAAQAGRILVPTQSLPAEYDIPYPFARAPRERLEELLTRYTETGRASRQAANAVGAVAKLIQAPSRALTLTRSAIAVRSDRVPEASNAAPWPIAEADGCPQDHSVHGPVETTMRDLGVTDVELLARSSQIDRDADRLIIDAAAATEACQRSHVPNGLNRSAGTAALVNHALKSGDPRAVALLRPLVRSQREPPEREP